MDSGHHWKQDLHRQRYSAHHCCQRRHQRRHDGLRRLGRGYQWRRRAGRERDRQVHADLRRKRAGERHLAGVLPTDSGTYVKGNTVALADGSGLSLTGTTTSDKGTALFVGWSKTPINSILSQNDTMPAGVVEQVTFTDSSITVYAVWGWDTDNDGKPDITQNPSITSSAGKNGSIAPEGKVYVPAGNSQKFDFTPDTGYAVDRGTIDGTAYVNNGVNLLPGMDAWEKWESYTFADVREDHTISVTFGEDTNNNNVPDANEGTVTLTYNANGGEGSAPAAQSANKWTAVTVAENTFTRSGYSFAGWNTQADGNGEDYAVSDAFQLTGQDSVLYAQWSYSSSGGVTRYTIKASAGKAGASAPPAPCGCAGAATRPSPSPRTRATRSPTCWWTARA
ncbi:InlB B-repeat-containing protein [Flavonifractor plautii]|nr:InlB B-repeat-containing protein [Flavonifractor plautii]